MIVIFLLVMSCQIEPIDYKPKVELLIGFHILHIDIDTETICIDSELFFKNISNETIIIPNIPLPFIQVGITSENGNKILPTVRTLTIDWGYIPIMSLDPWDTYKKRICLNEYYPVEQIIKNDQRYPTTFELTTGKYMATVLFEYPDALIEETMASQFNCLDSREKELYEKLEYNIAGLEIIYAPPVMFEITLPLNTKGKVSKEKKGK